MSPDPEQEIADAVRLAQLAQLDLVGLMVAYEISPGELSVLLAWPAPVKAAFSALDGALRPLAKLLAARDGEVWEGLSLPKLTAYTVKAHGLVMESDAPDVPHASGVRPIRLDTETR